MLRFVAKFSLIVCTSSDLAVNFYAYSSDNDPYWRRVLNKVDRNHDATPTENLSAARVITGMVGRQVIVSRAMRSAGLATAVLVCTSGMAFAGGYVAPILDMAPSPPVLNGVAPQSWWLALLPLLFLAFAGRGGGRDNGLTPLPPDHGGPCFGEGTLIQLERGWVPVETVQAGERIVTSRGIQDVVAVDSWQPVEYRDRPVVIEGVRLSPEHGVASDGVIVPARDISSARARIDGRKYFHVLVKEHSWLMVKSPAIANSFQAESLCITADLKLAKSFPDLVDRHALNPVSPIRMNA